MGLFNRIKIETELKCPDCGTVFEKDGWQSKFIVIRGIDVPLSLDTYNVADIERGEIHDICVKCDEFFEIEIKNGKLGEMKIRHNPFM